jgi:hypothetical protein
MPTASYLVGTEFASHKGLNTNPQEIAHADLQYHRLFLKVIDDEDGFWCASAVLCLSLMNPTGRLGLVDNHCCNNRWAANQVADRVVGCGMMVARFCKDGQMDNDAPRCRLA